MYVEIFRSVITKNMMAKKKEKDKINCCARAKATAMSTREANIEAQNKETLLRIAELQAHQQAKAPVFPPSGLQPNAALNRLRIQEKTGRRI